MEVSVGLERTELTIWVIRESQEKALFESQLQPSFLVSSRCAKLKT